MEDGVIRVQTVEAKEDKDENDRQPNLNQADLSSLTNYWMLNVHDNNYGSITTLVPSFDDRHIFSSAADGNFFVFTMMTTEQIEEAQAVAKAKIPSARVSIFIFAVSWNFLWVMIAWWVIKSSKIISDWRIWKKFKNGNGTQTNTLIMDYSYYGWVALMV